MNILVLFIQVQIKKKKISFYQLIKKGLGPDFRVLMLKARKLC